MTAEAGLSAVAARCTKPTHSIDEGEILNEDTAALTPEDISALFTRSDGQYFCARWGRPLAPIVFGVADETLSVVKGAFEAVCALTGHKMTEHDPELGTNLMMFFVRDWAELRDVPDLDRLVDGLPALVDRLEDAGAHQHRTFRFDTNGSVKACFVFLRIDGELAEMSAEALALGQAVQSMLVWSDTAFAERSPLARVGETIVLRSEIASVLQAAYDPILPPVAQDNSHALRIFARATAEAPRS